mmetsp:Transcript_12446/g.52136  ORF Transcript_12446/g.52136 Transcript_12446/m.52136 type:complete len:240 (+) Transcript_12446:1348-2067(+)
MVSATIGASHTKTLKNADVESTRVRTERWMPRSALRLARCAPRDGVREDGHDAPAQHDLQLREDVHALGREAERCRGVQRRVVRASGGGGVQGGRRHDDGDAVRVRRAGGALGDVRLRVHGEGQRVARPGPLDVQRDDRIHGVVRARRALAETLRHRGAAPLLPVQQQERHRARGLAAVRRLAHRVARQRGRGVLRGDVPGERVAGRERGRARGGADDPRGQGRAVTGAESRSGGQPGR